ncbi:MAG: D-cysteine desulfhydrase family protein [Ignavibacteriae bacterium]|nr:D-cysteine desulfhydrase family protein [Ignavibacteriota bacterium]
MINSLLKIPTIKLSNLPTPLDEANRLAEKIGLSKLFIKRDDLTGLAGGGNKARKLEFDFAEILNNNHNVIITAGGIQSNHARMTAAAARKLGIDIKLVLGGSDFDIPKGNLLLDVLFDAEIRYLINDDSNASLEAEMFKWANELKNEGKNPFVIPIGGSTGLGALGYVKAMQELSEQVETDNLQIILGVGSCGTFAGIILGAQLFLPNARIIGISVSRTNDAIKKRTLELINESASLINFKIEKEINIECYDKYHIEYGIITDESKKAIWDCANLEGILLDPIYTGKVMSGLIDLTNKNIINKNIPVVFIHTGGFPINFSFEEELSKNLNCKKIYSRI